MVLRSPVAPPDGVIAGAARVNGDSAARPGSGVGSENTVAEREGRLAGPSATARAPGPDAHWQP